MVSELAESRAGSHQEPSYSPPQKPELFWETENASCLWRLCALCGGQCKERLDSSHPTRQVTDYISLSHSIRQEVLEKLHLGRGTVGVEWVLEPKTGELSESVPRNGEIPKLWNCVDFFFFNHRHIFFKIKIMKVLKISIISALFKHQNYKKKYNGKSLSNSCVHSYIPNSCQW